MTLYVACVVALWLTYPTLWTLVWFMALMITLHAAIRARIDERAPKQPVEEGHRSEAS